MNCCPLMRRVLSGLVAVAIVGPAAAALLLSGPVTPGPRAAAADQPKAAHDWHMFGGSASRNMVNTAAKGVPTDWDVAKGTNVKWKAELGTKAYGGPIIAGGHVYVGTNNDVPRNPRDTDADKLPIDKGVVMCFKESDGTFLKNLRGVVGGNHRLRDGEALRRVLGESSHHDRFARR